MSKATRLAAWFVGKFRCLHAGSGLITCEGLGHPALKLLNPGAMAGMGGQEFRRLLFGDLLHPFPYADSLLGIVPGICRQQKPDIIRLRFVLTAIRQNKAEVRQRPTCELRYVGTKSLRSRS